MPNHLVSWLSFSRDWAIKMTTYIKLDLMIGYAKKKDCGGIILACGWLGLGQKREAQEEKGKIEGKPQSDYRLGAGFITWLTRGDRSVIILVFW